MLEVYQSTLRIDPKTWIPKRQESKKKLKTVGPRRIIDLDRFVTWKDQPRKSYPRSIPRPGCQPTDLEDDEEDSFENATRGVVPYGLVATYPHGYKSSERKCFEQLLPEP